MIAPKVILITDPSRSIERTIEVIERAAGALEPGALMVQLRDKTSMVSIVAKHARRLREVTTRVGALLTINLIRKNGGRLLDVAEEIAVDGLHVPCGIHAVAGARTIAPWVSVPTHTEAEARASRQAFADAILVSPIFATPGKGLPRGVGALHGIPNGKAQVYALGGVTARTAAVCATAGARGVAVIRALLDADDPAETARLLAAPFTVEAP